MKLFLFNFKKSKISSLIKRFIDLLGAGPHLLLLGLFMEGLTIVIRRWISLSVSLNLTIKIISSSFFIIILLLGMIWFNRSLNLVKVNLFGENRKLITNGPFNYVRHPLYSTLLFTIPPLFIIWFSDLLFLIPWVVLVILSHYIIILEERKLVEIFGEDYQKYRDFVPPLIPYKGSGGTLYRKQYTKST